MTAKEYLSQYRYINININNKIAQQERLRELATCVSPSSDGCGHNSGVSDKVGSLCAKIADLDAEINAEIDKLVDVQKDIMQTISRIGDERLRIILTERYIGCKTFEQIADDIHYSYKQTCRLHGQALICVQDVLECPIMSVV